MPSGKHPANVYAELMFSKGHGLGLWFPEPSPSPTDPNVTGELFIGDVGYVDDGAFIRLFNITRSADDPINLENGVPDGFSPLVLSSTQRRRDPLGINPICSRDVIYSEVGLEAGAGVPGAIARATFRVACRSDQGAMLMAQNSTREYVPKSRRFERYMLEHHQSWCEKARALDLSLSDEAIVLVTGVTKASEWTVAAWSQTGRSLSMLAGAEGGGVATAGGWVGRVHLMGSSVKKRLWISRTIKAKAGPHELSSDGSDGEAADGVTIESVPASGTFDDPLDHLLDYILEITDAEVAIASHLDIEELLGEGHWPEDMAAYLKEHQLPVDVDEAKVGRPSRRLSLDPQIQVPNPNEVTMQDRKTGRTSPMPLEDAQVLGLIENTLRDGKTERMLSLQEGDAKIALNMAWDLLVSSSSQRSHSEGSPPLYGTPASRSILRQISVELALKYDTLPSSIFLGNIRLLEPHPWFAGGSAEVYHAKYGDIPVALKKIRTPSFKSEKGSRGNLKALYVETLLWKGLSHPNVVPFLGVSDVFEGTLCMVTLWRSKTISQHRADLQAEGSLSAGVLNQWLYQIALGLAYLHEEGLIHGDLRGLNILVDEEGTPQLADFSVAIIADTTPYDHHPTYEGAIRWTAPELLIPTSVGSASSRPTTAGDVYSFACLSIELYTGKIPYPALSLPRVLVYVSGGKRPPRPSLPGGEQMRDDIWELIRSCWAPSPEQRPQSKYVAEKLKLAA